MPASVRAQLTCGLLLGALIAQLSRYHWVFMPLGIAFVWGLEGLLVGRLWIFRNDHQARSKEAMLHRTGD